tara:strand:+ start:1304 stop:1987 length:684 start_codon:yes stop_codon:yes gene_type:complete
MLIDISKLNFTEPTELCCIMGKYNSDKGSKDIINSHHNYTIVYNELFKDFKYESLNVFELGIGTINQNLVSAMPVTGLPGASLYGWRDFFPNSKIFGADIDKNIIFESDNIKTFYCDQTNSLDIKNMWNDENLKHYMDIIIEDGLHTFEANVTFFENSIHKLKKNGIYIIEDIDSKPYNNGVFQFKQKISEWEIKYPELIFQLLEIPSGGKKERASDNTILIVKKIK